MKKLTVTAPLGLRLLVACLPLTAAAPLGASQAAIPGEQLTFAVYLDDREIGSHDYRFTALENGYQVVSEASYEVKFLFVTAYAYRHRSEEKWRDGCLVAIESRTDANGDKFRVDGSGSGDAMVLDTGDSEVAVGSDCPRTFAYWDRRLLTGDKLINSQTGEVAQVTLRARGREALPWNDGQQAQAYVLDNPEADIQLWYDDQGRWLGLRSQLENGRTISYRRSDAGQGAP